VEDGAIPIVINLVSSGTPMAQENAAATLQNLAVADDSIRWRIVEDGAVQPLIRYLDCSVEPCAQEIALGALRNLAACRDNIDVLCHAGFLPRLANCLRSGPVAAQLVAAAAVCHTACSTDARRLLGEAGIIGPLVKLLDAKSNTAQEYSAQVLTQKPLHAPLFFYHFGGQASRIQAPIYQRSYGLCCCCAGFGVAASCGGE
jgi:hypothetical protein